MKEMDALYAKESPYTAAEMKDEVINHLSEVSFIAPTGINRSCSLRKDISLDSLDEVELMMWCEKTFELAINHEEEVAISTVGDLLDTIERKKIWRKN